MKQQDIAVIILAVVFGAVMSIVISGKIFVPPKNRQQEVEVVQKISSKFDSPDSRFFNVNSFDPTKTITIGDNSNPDPFSNKSQ